MPKCVAYRPTQVTYYNLTRDMTTFTYSANKALHELYGYYATVRSQSIVHGIRECFFEVNLQ